METKGFNESDVSEKSKENLQSGVWQEVRQAMKTKIQHFTDAPEIQHFAIEKVSKNDNVYGVTWGNVVREYLKTAYTGENAQAEVVLWDVTYKVLKRDSVTVFYDADGNTLFDVENTRLEKEYEMVMKEPECQIAKQIEETGEDDLKCSGGIDEKCEDCEKFSEKEEQEEENEIVKAENTKPEKEKAKEKLEAELKSAKDKAFAEPIIQYLLKRCEEDNGLAEDVAQKHKTWEKCFSYIYSQARKQSKGSCAAVRDDVVYEWAEDYYHLDDKALEEKRKKEAEERKKREAANPKKPAVKNTASTKQAEKKNEPTDHSPKQKKNELQGQVSLFDLM